MKVVVNGLAVEYEERGSGKTLVMLHGWKDNLHAFDDMALRLLGSFRIVRMDLPGFGKSESPRKNWTLYDYTEFVNTFLVKLNIKPDILVGHSFGGRITIKGVATGILSAKKIVLISAAGVARRKTFRNAVLSILAKVGRVITAIPPFNFWKQKIRRKLYDAIGSDYFRAGELSGTFVNIVNEDLSLLAEQIKVPTLIIWGAEDDTTPISQGNRLNQLISGSKFKVINGAGHFVHKEKPDEVAKLIREFCL